MKDPPKDAEDEPGPSDAADDASSEAPGEPSETGGNEPGERESVRSLPPDEDDDRPGFARGWPESADLDRLLLAFQRGNYAFVRAEAPRLAKSSSSARVREAASDLRRRIDPDPLAGILILVAIALLVTLSGYYLSGAHQHDETPAPNVKPQPVPMQPRTTAQPRST